MSYTAEGLFLTLLVASVILVVPQTFVLVALLEDERALRRETPSGWALVPLSIGHALHPDLLVRLGVESRRTVLFFGSDGCPACTTGARNLAAVVGRRRPGDVDVVLVTPGLRENQHSELVEILKEIAMVVPDAGAEIRSACKVPTVPFVYVVSAAGVVLGANRSMDTEEMFSIIYGPGRDAPSR